MKQQKPKKLMHYDRESDVFYIGVQEGVEEEYVEVAPGGHVELGEEGKVIGIELLNAAKVCQPVSKQVSSQERS